LYQLIRQLLETRVDVPLMIEGLNAIQPLSEGNNLEISATGVRADVRRGRTANTHSTTYEKQARLSFQAYPSSYLKPVVVPEVRTHVLQIATTTTAATAISVAAYIINHPAYKFNQVLLVPEQYHKGRPTFVSERRGTAQVWSAKSVKIAGARERSLTCHGLTCHRKNLIGRRRPQRLYVDLTDFAVQERHAVVGKKNPLLVKVSVCD
jgi:hypothetical protein